MLNNLRPILKDRSRKNDSILTSPAGFGAPSKTETLDQEMVLMLSNDINAAKPAVVMSSEGVSTRLGVDEDFLRCPLRFCWTLPGVMMSGWLGDFLGGGGGVPPSCNHSWWAADSDGFRGILFADEDFEKAEFGLDPLVLLVLLQHWDPVLLLNVSVGARGERETWEEFCMVFSLSKAVKVKLYLKSNLCFKHCPL